MAPICMRGEGDMQLFICNARNPLYMQIYMRIQLFAYMHHSVGYMHHLIACIQSVRENLLYVATFLCHNHMEGAI